jgi:Tol biopolymer transport system component/DNA-binding winged helix-turn-helix (wHTH) protein
MSKKQPHLYEFGPFCLDTAERLLLRDGKAVAVTPKAFETLVVLVERRGRLVEKDELMEALWPETVVEEANLTNNVWALRKTLGDGQDGNRYIETVPKRGYRFIASVNELSGVQDVLVVEKHSFTRIVTEEMEDQEAQAGEDAETRGKDETLFSTRSASTPSPLLPLSPSQKSAIHNFAGVRLWLTVAVLFVAGAAAFGIYRFISQRQPRDGAKAAVPFSEMSISRLTTSGQTTHAAISPDGKYVAHVTKDTEGDSLWISHVAAPSNVRIAGPAATEYVWVTFAPDGDSVYYLTLDRDKGDTALYRVPVLGGPSSMAAYDVGPVGFSPDRRRMAFIRQYHAENRLIVADADGTNERALATRREPEFFRGGWNAPAWSPDGKTIVCPVSLNDERTQYETIIGVSVEDGSQRPLTSARWKFGGQPAWLADGSGLLVTASESANAPAQIWHVALKSGEATRITNDLNNYYDLSLTADASRLAAVQDHTVSSIWVAPDGDAGRAKQIASDIGWIAEMAWTPDGRIVYRSNAGGSAEIWVMNADGSNPTQLTVDAGARRGLTVSPDGRYIFFASDRAGYFNIWRMDSDGGNLKQLTSGDGEFYPQCTPDGHWVVYQRGEVDPRLWKVPTDGGKPEQLTQRHALRPAVSPDGELIAYHYLDSDLDRSQWGIGIVSSEGGPRLKRFDFPPTLTWKFVRWSPDGKSIAYANNPGGLSDIWLQPLDGSQPRPLTDFRAKQIIAFDWSRDGRSLAFVRGVETRDVVLIEQGQK